MKILVTGATGFVGRNFIPDLFSIIPECEIMILSRDTQKAKSLYNNQRYIHASTEELGKIVEFAPEIVFHLASFISSRNDGEYLDNILQANIVFGIKLLDALKSCPSLKLFVDIGSFAEYRMGASEINNAYLYSASKSAFRQFVDYYSNLSGYKYIHIVPYTIYGGEDTQKKIIDYIYDSFVATTPVKMSGGEQILDFTHVKDVSSFFCFIVANLNKILALANGEILHLGTGKGITIKGLAALMEKVYNQKCNIEWGALPYRDMDVMHAVAPIGKLLELGWKPKYELIENLLMHGKS